MDELLKQIGETIREASGDWSRTARLCVLLAVAAACWTCYQMFSQQ